jgi:hypothetical protein
MTDQQISFRNRWSSRTSSRIASVEDELANRLRELVALPPALESPCALALAFRCGGAKFVRGNVGDSRGLASSVRGMPCRPSQVSRRGVRVAGRRACLRHRALAPHPGADLRDRLPRPRILRPSRLEEIKNVLRARCRPQGEELVIRIGEDPPRRIITKRGPRSFGRIMASTPAPRICPRFAVSARALGRASTKTARGSPLRVARSVTRAIGFRPRPAQAASAERGRRRGDGKARPYCPSLALRIEIMAPLVP